jgi:O-methyltransferase
LPLTREMAGISGPFCPESSLAYSSAYDLYVEHLKLCLSGSLEPEGLAPLPRPRGRLKAVFYELLRRRGLTLARPWVTDPKRLAEGQEWPLNGLTMIGLARLENIRQCAEQVLRQKVPGDFIEAGVWRGGAGIFMKAILAANGDTDRHIWLADSFEGIPPPDPSRYPADADNELWSNPLLAVPLDEVRDNFDRYGLQDDRIHFIKGWFRDTLPTLSEKAFALIRLDGDLYESTMDGLTNLYPSLSPGGIVIIDDYGNSDWGCGQAVDDYRSTHGITEQICEIDWTGVYWQKGERLSGGGSVASRSSSR